MNSGKYCYLIGVFGKGPKPGPARGPASREGLKPGPGPGPTFKARARPGPVLLGPDPSLSVMGSFDYAQGTEKEKLF